MTKEANRAWQNFWDNNTIHPKVNFGEFGRAAFDAGYEGGRRAGVDEFIEKVRLQIVQDSAYSRNTLVDAYIDGDNGPEIWNRALGEALQTLIEVQQKMFAGEVRKNAKQ